MFEKEAEEEINKEHWKYSIFKDLAQEYWQKGAEFGYNKANEWHDLRKDPNDLPEEYSDILIYTDDCEHRTVHKCNYHYGKWWVTSQSYYDVEVIAWKEIVIPKESE